MQKTNNRERFRNREYCKRRNISITDSDLELASVLGCGNVSHGIKLALRMVYLLDEVCFEVLEPEYYDQVKRAWDEVKGKDGES